MTHFKVAQNTMWWSLKEALNVLVLVDVKTNVYIYIARLSSQNYRFLKKQRLVPFNVKCVLRHFTFKHPQRQ